MLSRIAAIGATVILLAATGCAAWERFGGASPSVPDAVVTDMLQSQVVGLGGCSEVLSFDTLNSEFFPSVKLHRTRCTPQHGGSATAYAGRDLSGIAYLLGNEAGFAFLLHRHTPTGIRGDNLVAYVETAMRLNGLLHGDTKMLLDTAAATAAEIEMLRLAGVRSASRVLTQHSTAIVVEAVLVSPDAVLSLTVQVTADGNLVLLQRFEWIDTRRR